MREEDVNYPPRRQAEMRHKEAVRKEIDEERARAAACFANPQLGTATQLETVGSMLSTLFSTMQELEGTTIALQVALGPVTQGGVPDREVQDPMLPVADVAEYIHALRDLDRRMNELNLRLTDATRNLRV